MKYVQRRANRYEFRFPLPDDLAGGVAPAHKPDWLAGLVNPRTGRFKTEIVRSLKTNDGRAADRAALSHIAEMHSLVDAARAFLRDGPRSALAPTEIAILAQRKAADLLKRDEALRSAGLGLDLNLNVLSPDGEGMTSDDAKLYEFTIGFLDDEVRDQLARQRPSDELKREVEALLAGEGVKLADADPGRREMALALLAQRRAAFDSIKARLAGEVVPTPALQPQASPRLSAALERWSKGQAGGQGAPRAQTAAEAKRAVRRFIELHGDLPIDAITKAHGRSFRDAIAKLPKHLAKRHADLPLPKLLQADLTTYEPRSLQTVNKVMALIGGVLARAQREGYFDCIAGWTNPFHVTFEIAHRDREPYEPFSSDELKRLFASPVFANAARPIGGASEAAYWFPLIALYSGARRTEIAQLRVGDIRQSPDGTPFIDINEEGDAQALKNASSARSVPIHPELVRLGLLRYVDGRRRAVGLDAALWPGFEAPLAAAAKSWSKWFGRYLGEHVSASRAKTFHSFRHTFKRACREAGITEEVHHAFTGHAGGGVGRSYGRERREDGSLDRGVSLERLAKQIRRVVYKI